MRPFISLATVLGILGCAAPACALDPEAFAVGFSGGYTSIYQYATMLQLRGHPLGRFSELAVQFEGRSQALSSDASYAIESSGLGLALGGRYALFRGGIAGELSAVKRLQIASGAANRLAYQFGPGVVVEPYAGLVLPFLGTPFSEADVTLHWPIYANDPAFGPRLMATLWLGGKPPRHLPGDEDEQPPAKGPTVPPKVETP